MNAKARGGMVLLAALAGCSSSGGTPAPAAGACAPMDAIVAVSDYSSSGVGAFALDGTGSLVFGVDLGTDPALASSNGRTFVVARLEDRVLEIDARCGTPISKINVTDPAHAFAANPQDVGVAPDGTLWIPRYNVPSIAIVDGSGAVAQTIDLSSYDPDGNPNASLVAMETASGAPKAFVMLQRLDDTQNPPKPNLASQILRVDVATRAVEATVDLAGRNPFGMKEALGSLWVAEPGDFFTVGETMAGVERFDPATSTSALVVTEAALGGSVAEVAVTGGCAAAIVADASAKNRTSLVTFDPETGAVLTTASSAVLGPTDDFYLQGLLWRGDGAVLMVGDRAPTSHGYAVHAFDRDPNTCTLHARPDVVFLQKPPVSLRAPHP